MVGVAEPRLWGEEFWLELLSQVRGQPSPPCWPLLTNTLWRDLRRTSMHCLQSHTLPSSPSAPSAGPLSHGDIILEYWV